MPFSKDEFLADVLKNVPEGVAKAVKEAFNDTTLTANIGEQVMRQSEFSRQMDDMKTAREKAEGEVATQKTDLETEKGRYRTWYEDATTKFAASEAENAAYRKEFGELEAGGNKPEPNATVFTREEHDKILAEELEKRDRNAMAFADLITDLKFEHRERFSEKLNTTELYAHVEKTSLPLEAAYKDMVAPRIEKANETKHAEQLKQAREDGRQDALSSTHLPVSPEPSLVRSTFVAEPGAPSTSDERVKAATEAFLQSQQHPASP